MTSIANAERILRQLSAGDGGPVLVADFQAFSTAPRLSQLLSGRAPGPVYQVDPVSVLSGSQGYLPLPELAAAAVDAFVSSGPACGRAIVIGHCSAAALSLRMAKLLEFSRPVTVILVQPTWPDDEHIKIRFADFQAKLGAERHPCPELDGDPCRTVARMEQILGEELTALAARNGLSGSTEVFSDLLAWYRGWLAFLLSCRNDRSAAITTETITVQVLTDAPARVTVPGLNRDAYQIGLMPAMDEASPVSEELADLVAGQLTPPLDSPPAAFEA